MSQLKQALLRAGVKEPSPAEVETNKMDLSRKERRAAEARLRETSTGPRGRYKARKEQRDYHGNR